MNPTVPHIKNNLKHSVEKQKTERWVGGLVNDFTWVFTLNHIKKEWKTNKQKTL